ncbi:MFS transporter [Brevibacterium sanguinis]|uniref:MFS transporter n=1 Tax=Brevibacterium sanguinis TaxID=232444 RepID=UPI0031D5B3E0
MSSATITPQSPLASALRKARWRILPLVCILYFIAYLDRNNVGFAREEMSETLNLSASAFGLAAGLFFIGYTIFEIPSNAGMHRFGARRWIARILIPWGLLAMGTAFVVDDVSFSIVRLLLGIAEAGFFPAVVFYLTLWFPVRQRAAILGVFVLAQPIANMLGAPISGLLLQMHGVAGLHGWQWMFLVEGFPAVIFGLIVPFIMTDHPAAARWLTDVEKAALEKTIDEDAARIASTGVSFSAALRNPLAWGYALLNFGMVLGIYGLAFWLPSIVSELGDFAPLQRGLVVAIPYAAGASFVLWWSGRADRTGKRALHVAVSLGTAALGLVVAGFSLAFSPIVAIAALCVVSIGVYSAIGPMLSMSASLFVGPAAAAGIALVGSVGNIAGFVSPVVVGWLIDATGSTQAGVLFLASALGATAIATVVFAGRRPEGNTELAFRGSQSMNSHSV